MKQENQEHWLERDPEIKCYLPGVPRATYMPYPFQIFQSENSFFIAYEYAGAVRDIFLEDPGPAPVDSWMGQSYGKWDGDTLVVEVTGLLPDSWLDRSGNHHSEQMKVTERYTMTSPNHISYEATIEDPATFEKAWKISMPLYRRIEPERAAHGLPLRRVRRGAALRRVAQEPAAASAAAARAAKVRRRSRS